MKVGSLVVGLIVLTLARGANAQSTFGAIIGTAQDQSGLALPEYHRHAAQHGREHRAVSGVRQRRCLSIPEPETGRL